MKPRSVAWLLVLTVFTTAVAYAAGGGVITLNGSTSGTVTVQVPAVAGSTTFQLPGSNGTNGWVLSTDGTGVTSWISNAGTASTALSSLTAAAATHTFQNANFAQTWAWGTLGANTALSLSSTGMTTGTLLNLSNTDAAANAGTILIVSNSEGGNSTGISSTMLSATNTGYAGYFSNATTNAGYAVYGSMTAHGNAGYAGYFANTDTGADANYGVYGSAASSSGYGGYFTNTSTGWALNATGTSYFNGSVGIGTTSPAVPLDIQGNVGSLQIVNVTNTNAAGYSEIDFYNSSHTDEGSIGWGNASSSIANEFYIGTLTDSPMYFFTNTSQRMTITGSGYVGIGTASPTTYIQVNGAGAGNIDMTVTGRIRSGDGSDSGGLWVNSGNTMLVGADGSNLIGFYNGGWTGLVQTTTGSVGIGTTAPAEPLHVYTSTTSAVVEEIQNGTGHCTVTPASSGNVSFACSSDVRLKKDIVDTGDALAWIDSIRVRDFTMKSDGSRQTGVIAQEMLEANPDMVHMGDDGYYTVDSPDLWKMIKATQQLQAEIAALQREVDALKTQNQGLRTDFATYKHAHP